MVIKYHILPYYYYTKQKMQQQKQIDDLNARLRR